MKEDIGSIIRAGRLRKGLNQAQLAKIMNTTPASISHWENNARNPNLHDFLKLVNELELVEAFFPGYTRKKSEHHPQAKHLKVLIVDDNEEILLFLTTAFRNLLPEAEVLISTDGTNALKILWQHNDVHAVIMDLVMPKMDGKQFIEIIQNLPRFCHIKTFVMSAHEGMIELIREAGLKPHGFFRKPLRLEHIKKIIEKLKDGKTYLFEKEVEENKNR